FMQEFMAKDSLEKSDIRKKITEKKKQADKIQNSMPKKLADIQTEAQESIQEFNKQFEIRPILLVNIVLKF
ncbi:MAG: hypothetical protein K0S41_239, partial [Anaerocolumna sp.]|nr:hypothetical protein [Anaerocolumna sp.]